MCMQTNSKEHALHQSTNATYKQPIAIDAEMQIASKRHSRAKAPIDSAKQLIVQRCCLQHKAQALTTQRSPPRAVQQVSSAVQPACTCACMQFNFQNKTRGGSIQLDCVLQESERLPPSSAANPARACACMQVIF